MKVNRINPAQKTYFFKKKNGDIFATEEREADILIHRRKEFELIGVSDGKAYREKIEAIQKKASTMTNEKIRKEMIRIFNEEIEIAKGHIEQPRDFSKVDINGNPIKLNI